MHRLEKGKDQSRSMLSKWQMGGGGGGTTGLLVPAGTRVRFTYTATKTRN